MAHRKFGVPSIRVLRLLPRTTPQKRQVDPGGGVVLQRGRDSEGVGSLQSKVATGITGEGRVPVQ